jgi:hypothetical protein
MTMNTNGSRDIVRRSGVSLRSDDRAAEQREQWRAEHLAVPGTGHIHVEMLPSDDDLAVQLARRVMGDPTDARLHVARVNHHFLADQPDEVFAALVDAFYAFGPGAGGLRGRLLNGVRRQIGAERARQLDAAVADGLRPSSPAWCPGSMLSCGVTGSTDIVRHHVGTSAGGTR